MNGMRGLVYLIVCEFNSPVLTKAGITPGYWNKYVPIQCQLNSERTSLTVSITYRKTSLSFRFISQQFRI